MPSLEELLKIKNKLKPTEIVTTLPSGEVFTERRNQDGNYVELEEEETIDITSTSKVSNKRKKKVEYLKRCGFVVDLEPDLTVGEALIGFYFGSQDVAADIEILEKYKISHILNVGTGIPNHFPTKFEYLKVDILDLPETRIIDYFDQIFSWIDEARINKKIIFVHCNAGISRSATIVVAYLMKTNKLTVAQAMEICKKQRNIRPNTGFAQQLIEYQKILGL